MLQCAGGEQYDFSMTPECVCPTSTASLIFPCEYSETTVGL